MTKAVVITPIHRLGVHFARQRDATVNDIDIVTTPNQLRGRDLRDVPVYFVTVGWGFRSSSEMWDAAIDRGAEPIEVDL
ncbi:hypothetical protein [Streptomyces sp. NPDC002057]|uniref:hypothetical protein n=1 Tax=Streptomyces sp. NPDC002057 TaxID=3154664 RepID=UPI00331D6C49